MLILSLLICLAFMYYFIGIVWAYRFFRIENNELILYVIQNWPLDAKLRIECRIKEYFHNKQNEKDG